VPNHRKFWVGRNVRVYALKQVTGLCTLAKSGWPADVSAHRTTISCTCTFQWVLTGTQ